MGNHKYFIGYLFWLLTMISWCFYGAVTCELHSFARCILFTCLPASFTSSSVLSVFSNECYVTGSTGDDDGFFMALARITKCNSWVFWIAINAFLHFFWVGSLLGHQLYQVSLQTPPAPAAAA